MYWPGAILSFAGVAAKLVPVTDRSGASMCSVMEASSVRAVMVPSLGSLCPATGSQKLHLTAPFLSSSSLALKEHLSPCVWPEGWSVGGQLGQGERGEAAALEASGVSGYLIFAGAVCQPQVVIA